jgi:hypothetical protein
MCHTFQLIAYIPGVLRKMWRHVILNKNYPDSTIFRISRFDASKHFALFDHDLYIDVTFMTAEKWVVPDPIQY